MPLTTSLSARFSGSASVQFPERLIGWNWAFVHDTVPTTELAFAGDKRYLFPLPHGAQIIALIEEHGAQDTNGSPTLDASYVLEDDNGDTVLYAAGTAMRASTLGTPKIVLINGTTVKALGTGQAYGRVCEKVTTAAATAAAVSVKCYVIYKT